MSGYLPGVELSTRDLEKLQACFISPELATKAMLRRVTSQEAAEYVGRRNNANYAGILFPYIWPGERNIRGGRLRRDAPDLGYRSDGTTKEERKYLAAPGSRPLLYLMPDTPPAWLDDTNLPICLTEGEKRSLLSTAWLYMNPSGLGSYPSV